MKNSCGALFYTYHPNGNLGIVLGLEGFAWLPFKGCNEQNETFEETAIREIFEETAGLVNIPYINLQHKFTSKRKNYYIGLIQIQYDIIDKFNNSKFAELRPEYKEKKELKFFPIETILLDNTVHEISKASIKYYWNLLQKKINMRNYEIYDSYCKLDEYKSGEYKSGEYKNECQSNECNKLGECPTYDILNSPTGSVDLYPNINLEFNIRKISLSNSFLNKCFIFDKINNYLY